jgi:hypothetical protein
VDLLIFVLAMLVVILTERSSLVRLGGYTLVFVAGLLKYYPLVLFALAAREQLSRAIVIILIGAVGYSAFVWVNMDLLLKSLETVYQPNFYGGYGGFGADFLATGFVDMAFHAIGVRLSLVAIKAALIAALTSISFAIALRPEMSSALKGLRIRELICLIAGSLLLCGCFFAGTSLPYREIFALLVLPGLIAASHIATSQRAADGWMATTGAVLLTMWFQPVESLLARYVGAYHVQLFNPDRGVLAAPKVSIAFWLLREAIWWAVATVLLAIIVRFLLTQLRIFTNFVTFGAPRATEP